MPVVTTYGKKYKLQILQSELGTLKPLHAVEPADHLALLACGVNKGVPNGRDHARAVEGVRIAQGRHIVEVIGDGRWDSELLEEDAHASCGGQPPEVGGAVGRSCLHDIHPR